MSRIKEFAQLADMEFGELLDLRDDLLEQVECEEDFDTPSPRVARMQATINTIDKLLNGEA